MLIKKRLNIVTVIISAIAMDILLGVCDYLTGYEFSFSLFYLVPITLVTWQAGFKAGLLISVISTAIWQFANSQAGETFSNPLIPYWNSAIRLGFFFTVIMLLSRLQNLLEREMSLSRTDFLTRLTNSRGFYEIAQSVMDKARRYQIPLTVTYLDADGFKGINDHFGHDSGDEVLRVIAETLAENVRDTDYVSRMGGDEFIILFPNTAYEVGNTIIQRVRLALLRKMEVESWPITFSIGAITYLQPPRSVNALVKAVDELMYEVKENGKNHIEHRYA